ncbi:hypothetical protein BSM4216_2030 [Bacillus smithii]|nr:hypothetical protein BSM4216_2030 [Bacillus smithii]
MINTIWWCLSAIFPHFLGYRIPLLFNFDQYEKAFVKTPV